MAAMVLPRPAPVETDPLVAADPPRPEPGPGEVLLRVRACGVCHTDLHIVEGELAPHRLPVVPGHQVVGTVEAVGPDGAAAGLAPGQRVGVTWLFRACGACAACRRGEENLCPSAQFTGYDVDGGYSTWMVADRRFVFPLPERFDDVSAAPLLCAGVIGYRALRRAEVAPGAAVGLYGFGASAHLAIQVARHWGCRVYVFTRSEAHRRLAEDLGAVWTGPADAAPPEPLDSAVSFAPAGQVIPRALAALRPGGTLAINAVYLDRLPEMPYTLLYGERTLRSVANLTPRDAREFLALAAEIPVRTEVERYPLREANAVLRRLKARAVQGAAVLEVASPPA